MSKLIILCGESPSGKTTWAKKWEKAEPFRVVLDSASDAIQYVREGTHDVVLDGDDLTGEQETLVKDLGGTIERKEFEHDPAKAPKFWPNDPSPVDNTIL